MNPPETDPSNTRGVVPFGEATRTWFSISLRTFGGPAGQIAVMHRELVDERRWIGEQRFLHALSYCTLLPGPEAQQLAIYLGWLLNGTWGGLVAGILFVLPGFVALMSLSAVYVAWGTTVGITALLAGLGPAVLAIVTQAVSRIGRRALTNRLMTFIAVGSFLALFVFAMPFPIVIAVAAIIGWVGHRMRPEMFDVPVDVAAAGPAPLIADDALHGERPTTGRFVSILLLGVVLWFTPVVAAAILLGRNHVFVEQGTFFSASAVVTFGGAYAVLSFVAQRAVEVYGWLKPGEMVSGLAFAETTPGPLIMVVQFVAFLGAYRNPGDLDPWVAAVVGATLVVWVTFVPCFLFVFLGAPYIERLRHMTSLSAALTGITASVVGVIANLSLYFALQTLFDDTRRIRWGPVDMRVPQWSTVDLQAVAVAALAFVLVYRLKWGVLRVLGICCVVGAALHLAALWL